MTAINNWPRVTTAATPIAFVVDINPDTLPVTKSILLSDMLATLTDDIIITSNAEHLIRLNTSGDTSNGLRLHQSGAGTASISIHVLDGGGDAQVGFGVDNSEGVSIDHSWHIGIDNSREDDFVISAGDGLGSGDKLYIDRSTGGVGFGMVPPTSGSTAGLCGLWTTSTWNTMMMTNSVTDDAAKSFRYCINHYDVNEEFMLGVMLSSNATANTVYVGGGTSAFNAATAISLYAAANQATTTGTLVAKFNVAGQMNIQGAPADIADGDTAISAANLQSKILTMTSSTSGRAPTVPTGTAVNGVVDTGLSLDWTFINLGDQTVTITQATGHTLVGAMAIAAGTSASFRTRVSAPNTAITYRL